MKSEVFYKTMSKFYDLVDIIYFRNYNNSPRKKADAQSKVIGIDLSKDMLGIARKKAHKADILNIKLYCMDATKLKFKDKCFDKVSRFFAAKVVIDTGAGKCMEGIVSYES